MTSADFSAGAFNSRCHGWVLLPLRTGMLLLFVDPDNEDGASDWQASPLWDDNLTAWVGTPTGESPLGWDIWLFEYCPVELA